MSDMTRQEFEALLVTKAWKDEAFRERLLADPKGTYAAELAAQGISLALPDDLTIQVVSETPTQLYLVLPSSPQTSGELSETDLEGVVGGQKGGRIYTCYSSVCTFTSTDFTNYGNYFCSQA